MFLKALFSLLLISPMSLAADYSIFEVRKSLPMENNEASFKDYYINAGNESGLKKGMFVGVIRSSSVLDPAKNITQGSLKIQIAKLQIIQVDKHISVGRLAVQSSNDERPSVEFEGIMIGDHLDMDSVSMTAPANAKAKRKTAAAVIDVDTDSDDEEAFEKPMRAKQVEKTVVPQAKPVQSAVVTPVQEVKPTAEKAPAPDMVKIAVPPPAPQSNLSQDKKNEKVL